MKISRHKISNLIAENTEKAGVRKKFAKEVAGYLLSEHRTSELDSILRDIEEAWAENGIVDVLAISAHSITPQIKKDIASEVKKVYPHAKHIVINAQNDPTILGGVRLEFANQQLDLSIENKLNKFKQLTANGKG
jgi:F0F1-type ATP synthase delta subunit